MKKTLYLFGIVLLAISSCTQDVVSEINKGRAIDFKVVGTKGPAISWTSDLDHFYVTAIDANEDTYFENVGFARLGDYFSSSPEEYYWPSDGSELKFYAYSPMIDGITISSSTQKIEDFTPSANISNHKDVVVATATGSIENETSGVSMNFNHILSRIHLAAMESNPEYDFSVKAVKIANVISSGDFDITDTDSPWEIGTEKTDYELSFNNNVELNNSYIHLTSKRTEENGLGNDSDDSDDAIIIPQNLTPWDPINDPNNEEGGAYIAIQIQIKSTVSGDQIFPDATAEYGWIAIPMPTSSNNAYLQMEAGNIYKFYLDFTNGAGYVEPDPNGSLSSAVTVLGNDIIFTLKVNPVELPTAESATRKALEGEWLAKKVEIYRYNNPEDLNYENNERYLYNTITDANELSAWFNNNGFYQFSVDNNYNIYMTTSSGVSSKSSFTLDEDGKKIYLECYKNQDGTFILIPEVYNINEETKECIIYLYEENFYSDGTARAQYLYYDKK